MSDRSTWPVSTVWIDQRNQVRSTSGTDHYRNRVPDTAPIRLVFPDFSSFFGPLGRFSAFFRVFAPRAPAPGRKTGRLGGLSTPWPGTLGQAADHCQTGVRTVQ
jgi:hypothetical protein